MKKLAFLFLSFCLFSIGFCQKQAVIPLDETEDIITALASDETNGRDTGSPGFDEAASYAKDYLKANGMIPLYGIYDDDYMAGDVEAYNVVAINHVYDINKPTIIISGHLDHIGTKEKGKDKIMNGANDNASGVTAAMQIGAYLSKVEEIDENVIVALYSGEERGLLGSKYLAKHLKEEGYQVDLVFNFEMIGVSLTDAPNTTYLTGYEMSNMAEAVNQQLDREFTVFFEKAKQFKLFTRSDNFPFYEEFNIPAQTFSSFDFSNYDYYHHQDDEVEELDIENMNEIINSMATAIEGILVNDVKIELN